MSELVKLKDLCLKITDGSHYSPIGVSSGYPMFSVKDMTDFGFDYSNCKYISEEEYKALVKADCKPLLSDVLIAKDGSYLKHVFVVKEEKHEVILSSIGILRPDMSKVDPFYLKYYLQTNSVKKTVAKKYVSGSALPRIILKNFGEIEILKKTIETQQRIASVLSALDDKIELNNRINAELEAMAKTLYDYWFVQFDFPDANGKPYKSSGGKMVYNEKLKRDIPEGWEVNNLCDIATIIAGGDKPQNISENENDYFSVPIYSNGIENQGLYGYTNEARINEQSITISARGTIGFCVLRTKPFFPIIRLIAVTPLKKEYLKYLYEYLKTKTFENSGSVQQQLTVPQISKLNVLYPPKEIISLFHNCTLPNIKIISTNQQENQQLTSLRDWLLPMLMNGQVGFNEDKKKDTPIDSLAQ